MRDAVEALLLRDVERAQPAGAAEVELRALLLDEELREDGHAVRAGERQRRVALRAAEADVGAEVDEAQRDRLDARALAAAAEH